MDPQYFVLTLISMKLLIHYSDSCDHRTQAGFQNIDCVLRQNELVIYAGNRHNPLKKIIPIIRNQNEEFSFSIQAKKLSERLKMFMRYSKRYMNNVNQTLEVQFCVNENGTYLYIHALNRAGNVIEVLPFNECRVFTEIEDHQQTVIVPVTPFKILLTRLNDPNKIEFDHAYFYRNEDAELLTYILAGEIKNIPFPIGFQEDFSFGISKIDLKNIQKTVNNANGNIAILQLENKLSIRTNQGSIDLLIQDQVTTLINANITNRNTIQTWEVNLFSFIDCINQAIPRSGANVIHYGHLIQQQQNTLTLLSIVEGDDNFGTRKIIQSLKKFDETLEFETKDMLKLNDVRLKGDCLFIRLKETHGQHFLYFSDSLTLETKHTVRCILLLEFPSIYRECILIDSGINAENVQHEQNEIQDDLFGQAMDL